MNPKRHSASYLLALIPVACLAAGIWYAVSFFLIEPSDGPQAYSKVEKESSLPAADVSPRDAGAGDPQLPRRTKAGYIPKRTQDTSGFFQMTSFVKPWPPIATLSQVEEAYRGTESRVINDIDRKLANERLNPGDQVASNLVRVLMFNCEGKPDLAYAALEQIRSRIETSEELAREWLYTIIHLQGVVSMRRAENDNCIMCRGESSCIIPIAPAAVHTVPAGSRQAIVHFTEYLEQFPDELEVRWLLNLAHMTLGEHPQGVDPRYRLSLDHFRESEFDIGKFRDIGHLVGVNRFNQSGGAIMEDFDNDGLLDIAVTSIDPSAVMGLYRNTGDGKFVEI